MKVAKLETLSCDAGWRNYHFVKITTVQTLTRAGLGRLGPAAIALADAEGLAAHAGSIRVRLEGTR